VGFIFAFLYLVVYDLSMPAIRDAHCHIFSRDQMETIRSFGVGFFVVNATQISEWGRVAELAQESWLVRGAIGVHPWYVSGLPADWDVALTCWLEKHPELSVGEIGLDKNYPDLDIQESVFRRGLQIAHDMKRVAHIHCVGAWGKMLEILRGSKLPPAMIFHAFSGSADLVPELVRKRGFFSFGRAVCDSRRVKLHDTVRAVPNGRILVESDASFVDDYAYLDDTIQTIADIRNDHYGQIVELSCNVEDVLNDGKI